MIDLRDTKNIAIISSGRTGGKLLANIIKAIGLKNRCKLTYNMYDIDKESLMKDKRLWLEKRIFHSHDANSYYEFRSMGCTIILNTRDIVESTLSWCIQDQLPAYHSIGLAEITPFGLDPNYFTRKLHETYRFYVDVAYRIGTDHVYVVDYNDFAQDYDYVKSLFIKGDDWNDSHIMPEDVMMVKNNGSRKDWIENYDEIMDLVAKEVPAITPKEILMNGRTNYIFDKLAKVI